MNEEMQILFDNYTALMDGGQYLQLKQELNEEQPANIAEYFEELTAEKQLFIFRLLSKDVAAEVFSYMDNDTQEHIVQSITDREVRNIVDEMFLDDTGGLSGGSPLPIWSKRCCGIPMPAQDS